MIPAPFGAVLDANALYPMTLRDTLLRCAELDMYAVRWSEEILEEARRNLVKNAAMTDSQAARLIAVMKQAFPEAMIEDFDSLIPAMKNDEKDRHVAAAAVKAGAQVIVTFNLKDFNPTPSGVEIKHPDEFLLDLYDFSPEDVKQLLKDQAADMKNPPYSLEDILDALHKTVPRFVSEVRRSLATCHNPPDAGSPASPSHGSAVPAD